MNESEIRAFLTKFPWSFEGLFMNADGKTHNAVFRSPVSTEESGMESQTLDEVVVIHRNGKAGSGSSYAMVMPASAVIPFMKKWGISIGDEGFVSYLNNLKEWSNHINKLRVDVGSFQTNKVLGKVGV